MNILKYIFVSGLIALTFNSKGNAIEIGDCRFSEIKSISAFNTGRTYSASLSRETCKNIASINDSADLVVLGFSFVGQPTTWEALGLGAVSGTSIAIPLAITGLVAGVGIFAIKLTVFVTKEECLDIEIDGKVKSAIEYYFRNNETI